MFICNDHLIALHVCAFFIWLTVCALTLTDLFPQGILFTTPECIKTPVDFVKLWLHEASRVYGDKLIDIKDMEQFLNIKADIARSAFEVSIP